MQSHGTSPTRSSRARRRDQTNLPQLINPRAPRRRRRRIRRRHGDPQAQGPGRPRSLRPALSSQGVARRRRRPGASRPDHPRGRGTSRLRARRLLPRGLRRVGLYVPRHCRRRRRLGASKEVPLPARPLSGRGHTLPRQWRIRHGTISAPVFSSLSAFRLTTQLGACVELVYVLI